MQMTSPDSNAVLLHLRAQTEEFLQSPAAQDFQSTLGRMRTAIQADFHRWSQYPTLLAYADYCQWPIRQLEYSFAAAEIEYVERRLGSNLSVLDVGCGVVPYCNWMSHRGHDVVAVDRLFGDLSMALNGDFNGFYGSDVRYVSCRAELLPFADASFDVVTSISVLEHLVPGNDRVALWEIARVLKPGGMIVMTFDIVPTSQRIPELMTVPALRGHGEAFDPEALYGFFGAIGREFEVDQTRLPADLDQLTMEDVRRFWSDGRPGQVERDYVAIGLRALRTDRAPIRSMHRELALYEGQAALQRRLDYFEFHAAERLRVINELSTALEALRSQTRATE